MTVASEISEVEYAGNGVTVAFSIPFGFASNSDIAVATRDSSGDATAITTGFAITGAGTGSGTCTFTTAPASGITVRIERAPEIVQNTDYTANDAFPAESMESALDERTYVDQYLKVLLSRCLQLPPGDASIGSAAVLPSASSRASKVQAYSSTGVPELLALADIGGTVTALTSSLIATTLDSLRRTAAEIAAGVTPTNYSYPPLDALRYGADPSGSADSRDAIQAAINVASAAGGGVVTICGGSFKYSAQLVMADFVVVQGAGIDATILKYTGSGVSVKGAGADTSHRKRFSLRDVTLDGTSAGATAEGIDLGWNMRSVPLQNVKIFNFPHYGIHFVDQNWIVKLQNVLVDTCGRTATNSSGIYKDAAVDSSTWNEIVFDNVVVEACGNSSSAAGGWNIKTTTANRGVYLINCGAEGNFGADEAYFQNLTDLQITNFYMERVSVSGQQVGLDLEGCSGGIFGGFISAEGAFNLRGLRAVSCNLTIDGANFGFWATSSLDLQSSSVHLGQNWTTQTGSLAKLLPSNIAFTGNVQLTGLFAPKFAANKNGTNQTGIVTATFTKVTFTTEDYDPTQGYDAANSKFVPIAAGIYSVSAQVTWVAGTDQDRPIIAIYRNGTIYKSAISQNSGTGAYVTQITCQVPIINTTDYIEVYVRQTSGVNQDISGSVPDTWFSAAYIGQSN